MNPKNPMNLLITGGCGFIGANLIEYLLGKGGYRIRAFDNLSIGRKEYFDHILDSMNPKNSIELITGDVRNREQVEEAVQGVDAVVHLAAHTNVVDSLKDPEENFEINAIGTLKLLEACRFHGVNRFVYASSNAAVGEQPPPIDENKVPAPLSPYGASKLAGEALCSAYYGSFRIKAISLRFANVYGPYSDHKASVVAKFLRRAKQGKPLIIYGDGNQTRDFIHAHDIARAIELALRYNPPNSTNSTNSMNPTNLVFQIATGVETKIIDLAEMIRGLAREAGMEPPEIRFEGARKGEIRVNYSDISKATKLLDFRPQIELREGLKRSWDQPWRDSLDPSAQQEREVPKQDPQVEPREGEEPE